MFERWRIRLRALVRREEVEAGFDEELRFHLAQETERGVARGLTPEEARRAALRAFGDVDRVKDEARETWRWRWLDERLGDARYGCRGLARNRGFTAVAVWSLGFGIAATTTLFAVVDAVDFRPLPYPGADRLVWLGEVSPLDFRPCPRCPRNTSLSTAARWAALTDSYEAFGFWSIDGVSVLRGGVAEYVDAGRVSAGFFGLLGVQPLLGRDIAATDTVSGAETVALVSYEMWQSLFAGDAGVLGARVEFYSDFSLSDASTATVVGVLPEDFHFDSDAPFWVALQGGTVGPSARVGVAARLAPGVSRAAAEAELRGVDRRLDELEDDPAEGRGVAIMPLRERLSWATGSGRFLLLGVTALVLAIALANVAGLTLARTFSRQAELTLRRALGASRIRLVRQLMVEGICLGGAGGAIGALLSVWGLGVASEWFRLEGSGISLAMDHRVIAFIAGMSCLTGILVALLPSLSATRSIFAARLGGRGAPPADPRRPRVLGLLLVAQVAASLVLLTGAASLTSEFLSVRYLDLGFEPQGLYHVSFFGERDRWTQEGWRPVIQRVHRQIAEVPGVERAALRHESAISPAVVRAEGAPAPSRGDEPTPRVVAVGLGYFRTVGTPLIAGRSFSVADGEASAAVALVNAAAAAALWSGQGAVGKRIFVGDETGVGEWLTVVGVVADLEKADMIRRHWPIVYRPMEQAPLYHRAAGIYVRLEDGAERTIPAVQAALRDALGRPSSALVPLGRDLNRSFRAQRFNALALNLFATFALLLAAMGIYGSVAWAVSLRTREIGIRVALGAERARILALVARHATLTTLAGVALGLAGSFVLSELLGAFVVATDGADPWTFVGAAFVACAVAILAAYGAARRASGVDPVVALRTD